MIIRHGATIVGAALLASTTAFAQSTATTTRSTSSTTSAQSESPAVPVTLVGCVQKESDYRKEHNLRRGGGLNVGIGEGDEYVLINATRVSSGSAAASGDCSSASSGEAFEITGPREEEFKNFVGKRVEISGTQKKAEVAGGTPTGGTNVMGGDLKLFEVEVSSVKEAAVATADTQRTETAAPVTAPTPAPATTTPEPEPAPTATTGSQAAEPAPTGTAGQAQTAQPSTARELPRTASPLALYELASLLFFGGAYGVRRLRTK